MRIKILAVGRIKDDYISEGIREYMKRMKRVEVTEVKDSTKEDEGKDLLERIKNLERYEIVSLDEKGEEMSSVEFASFLKNHMNKDLCFIVGGPDGLTKELLEESDKVISLSKMTFTHEMARLFLIEQIYRGLSILKGKTYHRE